MEPVLLGPPLMFERSARAVGEVGREDASRAEAAAAAASSWSRCRQNSNTKGTAVLLTVCRPDSVLRSICAAHQYNMFKTRIRHAQIIRCNHSNTPAAVAAQALPFQP